MAIGSGSDRLMSDINVTPLCRRHAGTAYYIHGDGTHDGSRGRRGRFPR